MANQRQDPGNSRSLIALSISAFAISALLCCLTLTSCSTSRTARDQANAEVLRLTGFWQPQQMYLLSTPHPRLYVEVDAVEGCSPPEATLNRLRDFLATWCQKPDGIEIVRSDVIPLKDALGVLPSTLARKYLNGPPENSAGPPPAFLYVLSYNDVQCDRPVVVETGHPGARAAPRSRLRNRNPHVEMLPYPAMIYMNVNWSPKSLHDEALLHEAGHVLGLAFRSADASAGHCVNRPCLMTASVHLIRFVLGLDHGLDEQLCDRCKAQLTESQKEPPPSNLRFVGPVLIRSEPGYQVLILPNRLKVIVGEPSEQDCRDFAAAVHAETPSPRESEDAWSADASAKEAILREPGKMREILTRAIADPDWYVRRVTPRLLLACAARYNASGQFTNAVDTCRQAIQADPNDDQGHNLLAWIKATCPDPSIRDGKEAVTAATRACELTRWKQFGWIDTLAAAYAEAGDFERAIKSQQHAMRIGHPSESEKKDMQKRLALYHKSQPFREGS